MRKPDFVIGPVDDPYLLRWYLIPRNRWFNVYLHQFLHDDDDRALHDHPWVNVSVLLRGRYREVLAEGRVRLRRPWCPVFRRATTAHRVELIDGPVWTLFLTGPTVREWGFHCPQGWVHWRRFVKTRDGGNERGEGCG